MVNNDKRAVDMYANGFYSNESKVSRVRMAIYTAILIFISDIRKVNTY